MEVFSKNLLMGSSKKYKAYLLNGTEVIDVATKGITEPINLNTTFGNCNESLSRYVIINGKLYKYVSNSLTQVGNLNTWIAVNGYCFDSFNIVPSNSTQISYYNDYKIGHIWGIANGTLYNVETNTSTNVTNCLKISDTGSNSNVFYQTGDNTWKYGTGSNNDTVYNNTTINSFYGIGYFDNSGSYSRLLAIKDGVVCQPNNYGTPAVSFETSSQNKNFYQIVGARSNGYNYYGDSYLSVGIAGYGQAERALLLLYFEKRSNSYSVLPRDVTHSYKKVTGTPSYFYALRDSGDLFGGSESNLTVNTPILTDVVEITGAAYYDQYGSNGYTYAFCIKTNGDLYRLSPQQGNTKILEKCVKVMGSTNSTGYFTALAICEE